MTEAQAAMYFDGSTYDAELDEVRLTKLMLRVYRSVKDGHWTTLSALSQATGGTEASVSARLRDLRKARFGAHSIDRRRVRGGLYEYRMGKNPRCKVIEVGENDA